VISRHAFVGMTLTALTMAAVPRTGPAEPVHPCFLLNDRDEANQARIEECEASAMEGDARAQYGLGNYLLGLCKFREGDDCRKGREWLEASFENGYLPAARRIGRLYWYGEAGFSQDKQTGLEFFHDAAEAGDSGAMMWLGAAYRTGDGVHKDLDRARDWFRKGLCEGVETGSFNDLVEIAFEAENWKEAWFWQYAWLEWSAGVREYILKEAPDHEQVARHEQRLAQAAMHLDDQTVNELRDRARLFAGQLVGVERFGVECAGPITCPPDSP
jgi:hypothetical protein